MEVLNPVESIQYLLKEFVAISSLRFHWNRKEGFKIVQRFLSISLRKSFPSINFIFLPSIEKRKMF